MNQASSPPFGGGKWGIELSRKETRLSARDIFENSPSTINSSQKKETGLQNK